MIERGDHRVVALGGGHGLYASLSALRRVTRRLTAVVTVADDGGSSGRLRRELGVLPPGDVLKCALALARNEREARRVLLSRLPVPENARLRGHTGGNLLLSMMEQYSGDFLAAVDGLCSLLGCAGRVWPVSTEQASICAEYGDGSTTRGEVEVDAGQSSRNAEAWQACLFSKGYRYAVYYHPPSRFWRFQWTEAAILTLASAAAGGLAVRRTLRRPG